VLGKYNGLVLGKTTAGISPKTLIFAPLLLQAASIFLKQLPTNQCRTFFRLRNW